MEVEKKDFIFYKISRVVLNKYGGEIASVHAVIWNSSQDGYICELSNPTIGNITHLNHKKVGSIINTLLKDGYIKFNGWSTRYRTKTYKYVSEMVEYDLQEKDMVTLISNNKRKAKHKDDRENEQYGACDEIGHVADSDNTCDEMGHQVGHNATYNSSYCPPIKNYKALIELINNYDFSSFSLNQSKETIHQILSLAEELGFRASFEDSFEETLPATFIDIGDCKDIQLMQEIAKSCAEYLKANANINSITDVISLSPETNCQTNLMPEHNDEQSNRGNKELKNLSFENLKTYVIEIKSTIKQFGDWQSFENYAFNKGINTDIETITSELELNKLNTALHGFLKEPDD